MAFLPEAAHVTILTASDHAGLDYHGPRRAGATKDGAALPSIGYASDRMLPWTKELLELKALQALSRWPSSWAIAGHYGLVRLHLKAWDWPTES